VFTVTVAMFTVTVRVFTVTVFTVTVAMFTVTVRVFTVTVFTVTVAMFTVTVRVFTVTVFTMTIAMFTVTVLGADRYAAVCHAVTSTPYRTTRLAVAVSAGVWLLSLSVVTPVYLYADTVCVVVNALLKMLTIYGKIHCQFSVHVTRPETTRHNCLVVLRLAV